jgi:hypothetical protein
MAEEIPQRTHRSLNAKNAKNAKHIAKVVAGSTHPIHRMTSSR